MVFTVGPQKKYFFFKLMKTLYLRIAALQITMEREKMAYWVPILISSQLKPYHYPAGVNFFSSNVGIAFEKRKYIS